MKNGVASSAHRGLSLLEAVLTIALFLILLMLLVLLFASFTSTYHFEQAYVGTSGSAGVTVTKLETLIRPADHVLVSHAFSGGTYSSGEHTVVLEIPSIDSSGNTISSTYDYAVVYTSGTNAYSLVEVNAASARRAGTILLTDALNSLTFTYDNGDFTQVKSVIVDVITRITIKGKTVGDHLHEQLFLRNFSP